VTYAPASAAAAVKAAAIRGFLTFPLSINWLSCAFSNSGSWRKSSPSENRRSKAKKTISSVLPSDSAVCSSEKSGSPVLLRATISPSMIASESLAAAVAMAGNLSVQSEACSRLQRDIAVFNAHLDAIAVEFYFVQPAIG